MSAEREDAFEQQLEVLRRSENESRLKSQEAAALRQKLMELTEEHDRTKTDLRKVEIRCETILKDNEKRQNALDIVVKELTTKKQLVEQVTAENTRLKRDLENASRHTGEMYSTLRQRSNANTELTKEHDAPSTLYMMYSFGIGCDPNLELLRSLFSSDKISCLNQPASYQQLSALVEIFRQKESVNATGWQEFDSLEVACSAQEGLQLIPELIHAIPSLKHVVLYGVEDNAAVHIAGALATAEHIESLSLPSLRVTDAGFGALMKVVNNREKLAMQSVEAVQKQQAALENGEQQNEVVEIVAPLILRDLDLSNCALMDSSTFFTVKGQCIASLNLSGLTSLHDQLLGEILHSCPALTNLSVAGCPQLTNEATVYMNASSHLTHLDMTGCLGINHARLTHVEDLATDLAGVCFMECPQLKVLSRPVTHFQCVSWSTPQLQEVTFQGISLHERELQLLSECCQLTSVSFFNCRLQHFDVFLRRMRRLTKLVLHACKGIMDNDVMNVCSTIEVLDLTDGFCITDKCITKIADFCRKIKELTLKRCSNVTDGSLLSFEKSEQLQYLNVLGCKKVSVMTLHRLVANVAGLNHIVHESLITAEIRVDREDDEEVQKMQILSEQKLLAFQKDHLGLQPHLLPSPPKNLNNSSSSRLSTPASGTRGSPNQSPTPRKNLANAMSEGKQETKASTTTTTTTNAEEVSSTAAPEETASKEEPLPVPEPESSPAATETTQ